MSAPDQTPQPLTTNDRAMALAGATATITKAETFTPKQIAADYVAGEMLYMAKAIVGYEALCARLEAEKRALVERHVVNNLGGELPWWARYCGWFATADEALAAYLALPPSEPEHMGSPSAGHPFAAHGGGRHG